MNASFILRLLIWCGASLLAFAANAAPLWQTDGHISKSSKPGDDYIFAVDILSIYKRKDATYLTVRSDYAGPLLRYLATIHQWTRVMPPSQEQVMKALQRYYQEQKPLATVIYSFRVRCESFEIENIGSESYEGGTLTASSKKKSGYVKIVRGTLGHFTLAKACSPPVPAQEAREKAPESSPKALAE